MQNNYQPGLYSRFYFSICYIVWYIFLCRRINFYFGLVCSPKTTAAGGELYQLFEIRYLCTSPVLCDGSFFFPCCWMMGRGAIVRWITTAWGIRWSADWTRRNESSSPLFLFCFGLVIRYITHASCYSTSFLFFDLVVMASCLYAIITFFRLWLFFSSPAVFCFVVSKMRHMRQLRRSVKQTHLAQTLCSSI